MKLAKELAKEAKRLNICEEWHDEMQTLGNKKALLQMYVDGLDFCLSNDYPTNDYIRKNFKGEMETFGVFLDDTVDLVNAQRCVALGDTKGRIEVNGYGVCEVYAKHNSALNIVAKDSAFIMVDAFDDCVVNVHAQDNAKVCINRYGGKIIQTPITDGQKAIIKVIEKHKKTY